MTTDFDLGIDLLEVVHGDPKTSARSADVLEIGHNGRKLVQRGNINGIALVRKTELQVAHGSRSVLQVFQNGVFGGGGTGTGLQSVDFTARDSTTHTTIYIANSSALEGSEDPTAAEWQIARYDSTADPLVLVWADGDENFDNILDSGGATPEYETYTYS